ncbi:TPA: Opacity protein opA54, partial [Neisseria gonorrhoeae]
MSESKNESSLKKLLFSSAAQAASEGNGRGPYVQADLAYAYEHITRDYPDAAGANK